MASKVYDTIDIELQDGTQVTVRPLTINLLRKFMEVIAKLDSEKLEETERLSILVDACGIAVEKQIPEIAKNREKLEDVLDLPTMFKIIEVAGGIKLGGDDATPEAAGLVGLN